MNKSISSTRPFGSLVSWLFGEIGFGIVSVLDGWKGEARMNRRRRGDIL